MDSSSKQQTEAEHMGSDTKARPRVGSVGSSQPCRKWGLQGVGKFEKVRGVGQSMEWKSVREGKIETI